MKKLAILGSTGSIGTQALEVADAIGTPVTALTTNRSSALLEAQARKYRPRLVAAFDEAAAADLRVRLADTDIAVLAGMDGLLAAAQEEEADTVLTAVVGMVGLRPTLAAIDAGKDIALANKETLVCAGELVTARAAQKKVQLLPVDSEHSAIFQCLQGKADNRLHKIILTASGGPFFGFSEKQLEGVTREQALKHPNWSMGAKITTDSATMMNKGLELIEAMWLFGVEPEEIEVVIHRESIIHSMVEFEDGAVLAQLGVPDMRLPIQYALTYPARLEGAAPRLDFAHTPSMTFHKPEGWAEQAIGLARRAAAAKGTAGAVFNSANEEAVALFLSGKIRFAHIAPLVEKTMNAVKPIPAVTLETVLESERAARAFVRGEHEICKA